MVDWRNRLNLKWATLHFGQVKVATKGGRHLFEAKVCLDGLDPKSVRVELYADGIKGSAGVRQEMTCAHPLADESGGYIYSASVAGSRPSADFTARVIPQGNGGVVPLENPRILWQH